MITASFRPALFALLLVANLASAQETAPPSGSDAPTGADATAPATADAADAPPAEATTSDEAFRTRVKTLSARVDDLKEKVFQSKARLLLLQEAVLGGDITSGARAVIIHQNDMGGSFVLESISYALDGSPIFTKVDVDEELAAKKEFEIFNGRIVPGRHQLAVRLVYRGHGFGVFNYVDGYRFKVQNSFSIDMEPGKATTARVVAFERGDLTTDMKERPSVRLETQVTRDVPAVAGGAGPDDALSIEGR
ncbi:MAG TPA: dihydrolipoamide acetyltransferase [Myxococcaceae bacterium]|nr:dihydrolipoamide acetyltransferase [Myxococcaceae bacterium]